LYKAISRIPTIDTGAVASKEEMLNVKGHIEFQNVTFAYKGVDGEERPVFKDLSLKIQPGKNYFFFFLVSLSLSLSLFFLFFTFFFFFWMLLHVNREEKKEHIYI
jgi:hypothetical protein